MSDKTFSLTLVLDEFRGEELNRLCERISDPESEEYGRYLRPEELAEMVFLPEEDRRAIKDWLESFGMETQEMEGLEQLIFVNATHSQVVAAFGEDVLKAVNRDIEGGKGARAILGIPRRLAGYVQKVGGLPGERGQSADIISGVAGIEAAAETASVTAPQKPTTSGPPEDLGGVTPADIRDIYEFPEGLDGSGETIAVVLFGGELVRSDVELFWRANGITPPQVEWVEIGPHEPRPSHPLHQLEASMVIGWAGAMAPGAKLLVYSVDPAVMGDPWAAFLLRAVSFEPRPTVLSSSWITPERQYYQRHGSRVFAGLLDQAAALGITVITASGDWGAFDGIPRVVRDGRPVSDAPWPHAVFPSSEERILSVGGTMITNRKPLTETAWSGPPPPGLRKAIHFERLAGSGGFSEEVPLPAWQRPVLRGSYPRGATSPAVVPFGRGYPDVALMATGRPIQRSLAEPLSAQGYQAVVAGQWVDFAGGTSVAAPIWAAIIALANQARRANGLTRCGFVTPLLYRLVDAEPAPFRTIVEGSNDVTVNVVNMHGRAVPFQLDGFHAINASWDPVTGLGVPIVKNLIHHLVSPPGTTKK